MKRTVNMFDRRMYMGYGALLGFVIGTVAWLALSQEENAGKAWVAAGIGIGTVLGRLYAWHKRRFS